jgi:UDP-N-acetylmuramyl pentapeptide phosphotransferase/UDP-N-acetylglucosamine-1-phosphate transferase
MTESNVQQNQELNLHEKERGIATADQNSFVARLVNINFFLFSALELLLAIRFILLLIGANIENGFASFIYELSAPFVSLFESLLQNPTVGTNGVLEVTTVIAMMVYGILAWLVGRMIWLVLSRPR